MNVELDSNIYLLPNFVGYATNIQLGCETSSIDDGVLAVRQSRKRKIHEGDRLP